MFFSKLSLLLLSVVPQAFAAEDCESKLLEGLLPPFFSVERPTTTLETRTATAFSSASTTSSSSSASSSSSTSNGEQGVTQKGRGTFYEPANDACTGESSSSTDMIVAISTDLYESYWKDQNQYVSGYCGKHIGASYKGNNVTVKVVDACASCTKEQIDFSPSAFKALTNGDLDIGEIEVTWSFLD